MRKPFKEVVHNDNGFTLVELLVTIAILGFILVAIGGALVSSAKSYRSGNVEVDLQQQSQLTANIISSLIQDASDVSFDGTKLEIKQLTDAGVTVYTIKESSGQLVYSVEGSAIIADASEQTLADHLKSGGFNVELTDFETYKNVAITLEFEEADKSFKTTYNMTARNGNGTGSTALVALKNIVLEPGETGYIPYVTNRETVLEDFDTSHGSSITPNVMDHKMEIRVDERETKSELVFKVKTVSMDASEPVVEDIVHVYVRRVGAVPLKKQCDKGEYEGGSKYTITTNFAGSNENFYLKSMNAINGEYNFRDFEDVVWSVEEGASLIQNFNPVTFTSDPSASVCQATFTLARDLKPGEKIVIRATALRPSHPKAGKKQGYGTIDNPTSGEVFGEVVIEKQSDIRRGEQHYFDKSPEQMDMPGLATTTYLFRIGKPDELDETKAFEGVDWILPGDSRFEGGVGDSRWIFQMQGTKSMDPTKAYLLQFAAVHQMNGDTRTVEQILATYTYGSAEYNKYVTVYQVDKAKMVAKSVLDSGNNEIMKITSGSGNVGSYMNPIEIKKSGDQKILFEAVAHTADFFQSNTYVKSVEKQTVAGEDLWSAVSGKESYFRYLPKSDSNDTQFYLLMSNLQNGFNTGDVLKVTFDWSFGSGKAVQEGDNLSMSDTDTGIIYIKVVD